MDAEEAAGGTKRPAKTPGSNRGHNLGTPSSIAAPPRKKRPEDDALKPTCLFGDNEPDLGNESQLPFGYRDTQVDDSPPMALATDPYLGVALSPLPDTRAKLKQVWYVVIIRGS